MLPPSLCWPEWNRCSKLPPPAAICSPTGAWGRVAPKERPARPSIKHTIRTEEHVHLRLHCGIQFFIAVAIASAAALGTQAQAPTQPSTSEPSPAVTAPAQSTAPATTVSIHGHITDQTGAL